MKKFFFAMLAIVALSASCNEELKKPVTPDYLPTNEVICDINEMPSVITRTALDAVNFFQVWREGDEISVIDGSQNTKFSLKTYRKDSPAFGVFTSDNTVNSAAALYAVYPYGEDCACEDGLVVVNYPSVIEYDPETQCAMGNNVMVAWNETNNVFRFQNACALVKINLTGSVVIKSIVISRKDGGDIAGKGYVNCGLPVDHIVVERVEGSAAVTINMGEDGILLDKTEPTTLVIGLAPVIDNGIVLKYITSDGDEVEHTYDIKGPAHASSINTINIYPEEEFKAPTVYLDGADFNSSLKTLAQGKSCLVTTPDAKVTGIVFKTGVDLSTISDGVDISNARDGRILMTFADGLATISTDGTRISTDMCQMFQQFNALESIEGMSCLYSSRTLSLDYTFANCTALETLDLGPCDFSNVISTAHTFENTLSLSSLDVTSLGAASPVTMAYMFSGCGSESFTGLDKLSTSDCLDMSHMFEKSEALALDLSSFDTSSDTTMAYMFSGTTALKSLNLAGFNTSSVKNMANMFEKTALESVDLSGFNTSAVSDMSSMFASANSMKSIDLSGFETDAQPKMSKMFRFDKGAAVKTINLGPNFNALYQKTLQNDFFPTKANSGTVDFICTRDFAQALISACTALQKNTVDLVKAKLLVMKNLAGKEFTYTDKNGQPIAVTAVTYTSLVVDPDEE